MRSLYRRQLTMMVGIMLVSFTLLAGAFMLLSYRYIISETRDSVERNAGYISGFTSTYYRRYLTLDVQDEFYSSYVATIAMISNSHIIVADPEGSILYAAARGAMPPEQAQTLMRPKTVWFLGELPKTGKKGETFGFATLKREGGYESVRCFLTPESARRFNREGYPVTPARVKDLEQFLMGTFALIIEPHRSYWLELGAEQVRRSGGGGG